MQNESIPPAWRRLVGLACLGCVVFLWTASSFMSSSMFADDTYSKPFLVTYINTAFFSLTLVPYTVRGRSLIDRARSALRSSSERSSAAEHLSGEEYERETESRTTLLGAENYDEERRSEDVPGEMLDSMELLAQPPSANNTPAPLSVRETLILSAKFAPFWFIANWFNTASFQHTSVASSTILTSTSSIFTLLFGAVMHVEQFTFRKLAGVLASLAGIALISYVDTKEKDVEDPGRGSFPYMSPGEVIVGDVMALTSAVLYGVYATGLTKVVGDESRVTMPIFFGFIGLLSAGLLWPIVPLLHATGFETFELPPSRLVWTILVINASISLVADLSWAYAVLLTSPLIVTVGLTLTIPLSLIGQIVLHGQFSSPLYWVGAVIVVLSFIFINYETKPATSSAPAQPEQQSDG